MIHISNKHLIKIKDNIIEILLVLFSIASFVPGYSLFSIGFFVLNFLYFKKLIKVTWTFFSIAIVVNIVFFVFIKPTLDKDIKEISRLGFHKNWAEASVDQMNYYNKKIIEYKQKQGHYPEKLSDIQNDYMDFNDMSFVLDNKPGDFKYAKFFYEKVDSSKYYLAGVGYDGEPKTKDDLLPSISEMDTSVTGLIKYTICNK
jgi:hypothetical protein